VQLFTENTMWRQYPLQDRYDVVIIGAGVHGLSTAYYLAKQGITNVAVIDKGYVGGGASGRNTAIIRANYLTKQGIPFFRESLRLYQDLAKELDFNLLFDQSGRLDIGHTDSAVYGLRMRTGVNRLVEQQVEIELLRQILVEPQTLPKKWNPLLRKIVGANDRRVPPARAASDITLVDHRNVRDALLRQVVSGRKTMYPGADDHDVVPILQRVLSPHRIFGKQLHDQSPCSNRTNTSFPNGTTSP
jgi:L-2-hydroxyglutarate oxidase LhgO